MNGRLRHVSSSQHWPFLGLAVTLAYYPPKPTSFFFLIDDLGWSDIRCYRNEIVDTPRIDQLALEGLMFTDFYAAGTVCSPNRCAV